MKNFFKKLLYAVLPMIYCNSVNSSIKSEQKTTWKKLENKEPLPDVQKFVLIETDDAKYLVKGIRDNITSLQDKAKVTAVAVTLAFSMVGGISAYMLNLKEKLYINGFLTGTLVFFVIASCFYLIMAGYYSLFTLNSRPSYDFGLDNFEYLNQQSSDEKKKKEKLSMIGEQYKMTSYQNTLLNNYVDCSNNNLRNALISLGIFFSLICLSFVLANEKPKKEDQQTKILTEHTQILKDTQKEIQTLKKEIDETNRVIEKDKQELSSSIDKLNSLIEETLKNTITKQ
ncbi:basic helix-loop-helix domain-containing protein [Bacillus mycoides]|uniref:hypothetical protein n=1 Tax=Bacillus mycoides TaxID=1405 RepID=UPI0009927C6E|nr:hypothetical protein [Bacillus mycoides]OOR16741.1 hypothetical protein BW891_20335 [Bacillus mycoides]